jgi:hypothetical protein
MDGYEIKRVYSWDLKATVQRVVQERPVCPVIAPRCPMAGSPYHVGKRNGCGGSRTDAGDCFPETLFLVD